MNDAKNAVDYDSIARLVLKEALRKTGGKICMQTLKTVHRRLEEKIKGSWFMVIHRIGKIIEMEGVDKFITQ